MIPWNVETKLSLKFCDRCTHGDPAELLEAMRMQRYLYSRGLSGDEGKLPDVMR
jgi:hypothetical protein